MAYRRIHFLLSPHGSPTSLSTIDYACALAQAAGAALEVTSPHVDVRAPSNWLAGKTLAGIAQDVEDMTTAKRLELEARLKQRCEAIGVNFKTTGVPVNWPAGASTLIAFGRTSDLCVLGLPRSAPEQVMEAEAWLFGTGRPCLLHPDTRDAPLSLDSIAIAWDTSRSAARAVGDALPLMKHAKSIQILVGRGEKELPAANPAASLVSYLAAHDIRAEVDEFDVARRKIGDALLERAEKHCTDLLVMGAFGHSRLQEFVLGGATRGMLDASPVPLFMSH